MKTYIVKSIFGPTLQGEGSLVGVATVFLRFGGCNVWDGRPETRAASACPYCDTDFFGGSRKTAHEIVEEICAIAGPVRHVTVSGGEPLLQLDALLAQALADAKFSVSIETNGTRALPDGLGKVHVVMSPKVPRAQVRLAKCDDLKVLLPHPNPLITPEAFDDFPAVRRFVQPVNSISAVDNEAMRHAVEFVQMNPRWALSPQLHKILGIP